MKIALAQINTIVGDFAGNVRLIVETAHRARDLGAELCLFPEQCIPGYPAHDLLERTRFIDQNLAALDQVVHSVHGTGMVVGYTERHNSSFGKGIYNSAALIRDGRIISNHRKSLLPTYDVFDESRYFDASPSVQIADYEGMKLGITICEDVWNDPDFWKHRLYGNDPGAELVNSGAEIIINIGASPFTITKRHLRRKMLREFAIHHHTPLIFVNSIGGNDDLIFDGSSVAFGSDGTLWAQGREFAEDLVIVDTNTGSGRISSFENDDDAAALEALVLGTRDYAMKCGFTKALVGLSGGIDSALVAVIGARALGHENVEALLMPSRYSSAGSVKDAEELALNLGIKYHIIGIHENLNRYLEDLKPVLGDGYLGVTEENLQARIRGNLLMAFSNYRGNLLLTTGNKSEMATGYCTLYGDMAGGLGVISDVPKTMVYRLCRLINHDKEIIPQAIIDKPPSAELRPGQKDSDILPPYDLLDKILENHIVDGSDYPALLAKGFDGKTVDSLLAAVRASEYKRRQAPPGLKITTKAFGFGRRMPLAQRWRP